MVENTVKLGSMEIEIITNASKAKKEIEDFSTTSALGIGAVGGAIGALAVSSLTFASGFAKNMPTVNKELKKLQAAMKIFAVNTDNALSESGIKVDTFSNRLLNLATDGGTAKDALLELFLTATGQRGLDRMDENIRNSSDELMNFSGVLETIKNKWNEFRDSLKSDQEDNRIVPPFSEQLENVNRQIGQSTTDYGTIARSLATDPYNQGINAGGINSKPTINLTVNNSFDSTSYTQTYQ